MRRRQQRIASLVLAASMVATIGTSTAQANSNCQYFPWCYSIAIDHDTQHISGVSMTANDAAMTLGDAVHINNTIWVAPSSGSPSSMEIGVCSVNLQIGGTCGQDTSTSLAQYVAVNGTLAWTQNIYTDGVNHSYALQGTANCGKSNAWIGYVDWVVVYTVSSTSCWAYANSVTSGGEIQTNPTYGLDSSQHTGGFSDYVYEYDSSWHSWYSHGAHIDDPCGTSNCFNGYYFSDGHWGWNKAS